MNEIVDLRSDTVTLPTPEMREAMARAEVGDDVWEEDPTVKRLEATAAERLGKEAGLFVTSGTQGNLVSILSQTSPGAEILLDLDSHIFQYEVGGAARLGGVQMRPLQTARGFLAPEQVSEALRASDIHVPETAMVTIENTHNRHGGTVCPPADLAAVAQVAHAAGLSVHLDGARLFNASVALGCDVRELARHADSVTFCLSKGLAAPVGSVVCGTRSFVLRARRMRKMLGGGMRQAGILAAAGLVALERMVERLAEDHANARRLAEGLVGLQGIDVDAEHVQTNIVFVRTTQPERASALLQGCAAQRIRIAAMGPTVLRCVTHKDVDSEDVDRAVSAFREITARWRH